MLTTEEALRRLHSLGWTEEIRPKHPWFRQILVPRAEVEKLLKEITDER